MLDARMPRRPVLADPIPGRPTEAMHVTGRRDGLSIGIAGAGLLGRLLAWRLARAGHRVSVFDPAPGPAPTFDGRQAAGFTAAGMLSPLAELDNSSREVAALGWRSIALWRDIVATLHAPPAFAERGSLLLAHRSDAGAAQRVLARLAAAPPGMLQPQPQSLTLAELAALEPSIQGPSHAWLLPREAQIDPVGALQALHAEAAGVTWHWGCRVAEVHAGELTLASEPGACSHLGTGTGMAVSVGIGMDVGMNIDIDRRPRSATALPRDASAERQSGPRSDPGAARGAAAPSARRRLDSDADKGTDVTAGVGMGEGADTGPDLDAVQRFDLVFDVRGTGARPALPVRGVRGEVVWLHAPGHGLGRPVRLLHPRHRVYLVPRPGDVVFVGASEVESEDRSPVSLRSAVELLAAAHSVMPTLAEARILRLDVNLRPALPDNEPHTTVAPGLVRINGLFRHGWLLAPALVDDALRACGLAADGGALPAPPAGADSAPAAGPAPAPARGAPAGSAAPTAPAATTASSLDRSIA